MSKGTRPSLPTFATALTTRHSSRVSSYCARLTVCVAAVIAGTSVAWRMNVTFAPGSDVLSGATSAAAIGDQPRGKRPASDCAPTDVSVSDVPLGAISSTRFVTVVSPPCVIAAPVEDTCGPRLVRRTSIGMTPLPDGTTIWRHTVVYPGALA